MPTGTPEHRPFSPRGTLTREQLVAYVEGRTPIADRHKVEEILENDSLLRDAAEGLALPVAVEGLELLDRSRPGGSKGPIEPLRWIGGMIVGIVLVTGVWLLMAPDDLLHKAGSQELEAIPEGMAIENSEVDQYLPMEQQEIMIAVEQPESLLIGHGMAELYTRPVEPGPVTTRVKGVERLDARQSDTDTMRTEVERRPARSSRSSRQLLYVHDLKLVHPKEMYGPDPLKDIMEDHVSAQHADKTARETAREPQRTKAYIPFITEALWKFTRNDHKGCLDDLRIILAQYTDDVNALFYAGLCSYNLGLYSRAREFLQRSAHHRIDTFDEESEWYLALTLDRLGEHESASRAFDKIIADQGFYAERARERRSMK